MTFREPSSGESTGHSTGGLELRVIGGQAPKRWAACVQPAHHHPPEDDRPDQPEDENPDEEVVRLTNRPPEVRHLDEVMEEQGREPTAPSAPPPRRRRRRKLETRQLSWILGGGIFVIMLAGIIGAMTLDREMPGERAPHITRFEVTRIESDTPLDALTKDSEAYLDEAHDILTRYLRAESAAEALPLTRHAGDLRERMEARWKPLDFSVDSIHKLRVLNLGERDGVAWMELGGDDDRGRPLNLVFVLEDDELQFDWAASFGIGEIAFADLPDLGPDREVEIRARISPDHYHDFNWPEDTFDSYKLVHPDSDLTIRGYAARGSQAAEQLAREIPGHGSLAGPRSRVPCIVRIKNRGQAATRQFEIIEVVSPTWIK